MHKKQNEGGKIMTKKILLILMASIFVLGVGCKAKDTNVEAPETPTQNEQEVESESGKYKTPSKEDAATVLEKNGFKEVKENVLDNEFVFEKVDGDIKTSIKFQSLEDKSFEVIVNDIKEAHIETESGFFHTETRTDENGFYYSAPLFSEEDTFKADIVVNKMHITAEGDSELVQSILKELNLPNEELTLDMPNETETPTESPETPVEDAEAEEDATNLEPEQPAESENN